VKQIWFLYLYFSRPPPGNDLIQVSIQLHERENVMSVVDYEDDWELDDDDSGYSVKESRPRKCDKKQKDSWQDDDSDGLSRAKRKTRWRDIEDRLERKKLNRQTTWGYANYDL
jgi:hypothetical protein